MIIKYEGQNFEELINTPELTIVDFYADWCGPCKMLGQEFIELSKENDVKIVKINVDNYQAISAKFSVYSIPAVFLFKNGKVINSFVGYRSKDELIKLINNNK